MLQSSIVFNVFESSQDFLCTRDILGLSWPKELFVFALAVGVFIKVVRDWIINGC